MSHERVEDVRRRTGDAADPAEQLLGLVVPLGRGERRYTWRLGPICHRRGKLAFDL